MWDIAKNVGEFAHGGFWILEWGILNVHPVMLFNKLISQVCFLIAALRFLFAILFLSEQGMEFCVN